MADFSRRAGESHAEWLGRLQGVDQTKLTAEELAAYLDCLAQALEASDPSESNGLAT